MSLTELILKRLELSSLLEGATEQSCAESLVGEISAVDMQIDEIVVGGGGDGTSRQRTNVGATIVEAPRMAFTMVSSQTAVGASASRNPELQQASSVTAPAATKEKNVIDCLRPAPAPDQWSADAVRRMRTYPLR